MYFKEDAAPEIGLRLLLNNINEKLELKMNMQKLQELSKTIAT